MIPLMPCYVFAGKELCFERIVNRFGRKCTYVIIGDGKDEEEAALKVIFSYYRLLCARKIVLRVLLGLNRFMLVSQGRNHVT